MASSGEWQLWWEKNYALGLLYIVHLTWRVTGECPRALLSMLVLNSSRALESNRCAFCCNGVPNTSKDGFTGLTESDFLVQGNFIRYPLPCRKKKWVLRNMTDISPNNLILIEVNLFEIRSQTSRNPLKTRTDERQRKALKISNFFRFWRKLSPLPLPLSPSTFLPEEQSTQQVYYF